MTSNQPLGSQSTYVLFPPELLRAPKAFWQTNRLSAVVFLVVNFFFGTLGLWLPPVNAFFLGQSFVDEVFRQLLAGGLYVYAITFLSAIAGTTFTSLAKDKAEHTRSLKVLLVGAAVVALFVCALFLQIQLLAKANPKETSSWISWIANWLQFVFVLFTATIAVYIHSIVSIEITGSPKEDMDEGAAEMLGKANSTDPATNGGWKS